MKHAHQRLADLTGSALVPFGISGRECAVLTAIDDLEHKGLVQRRQDPDDRRKNVVLLTEAGRTTLRGATAATEQAERRFLASLSGDRSAAFTAALRAVAFPDSRGQPTGTDA